MSGRRTATVKFKTDNEFKSRLRRVADRNGLSIAEVARQGCVQAVQRLEEGGVND